MCDVARLKILLRFKNRVMWGQLKISNMSEIPDFAAGHFWNS